MAMQLTDIHSIEAILSEMTLEEKARMVIGGSPFRTEVMPKYGIPAMYMIDSCNGLDDLQYMGEAVYQKVAAEAEAAGTPIDREKNGYMGGLLIATACVLSALMFALAQGSAWSLLPMLLAALGAMAIGFRDDYIKNIRHNHEGLKPRQKIIGQVVVGLLFSVTAISGSAAACTCPLQAWHGTWASSISP